MTFNDLSGNGRTIERLGSAILCGNISHAYIFEGDARVDKPLIARCFAKAILCQNNKGAGCDSCLACNKINHGNHEDITYVEMDGNSVKDEAIEELQESLKKKPYAGDRNIAIINNADTMTQRAQNRLLKTLEEPFAGTVIVLLSENAENLTKTILSRCALYHWNPLATSGDEEIMAEAEELIKMLRDKEPFYKTKARIMAIADCKENAYKLLDALEILYGSMAVGQGQGYTGEMAAIANAIAEIEEARRSLRRGMNLGYTLKGMILNIEED